MIRITCKIFFDKDEDQIGVSTLLLDRDMDFLPEAIDCTFEKMKFQLKEIIQKR